MIFDRTKHPVVPTMKGADLIEQAKKILREQEHFIEIAEKRKNEPVGDLRLAILPGLAPYLLPLFTAEVAGKYPRLNLKIFEINQKEMGEAFRNEELDAALTFAPFYKKGFYEDPIFEEEFVLYLNEKHPLSKQSVLKWEDIPFDELILQEDIRPFLLNEKAQQTGLPVPAHRIHHIAFENGSLETIRKVIDVTGGVTLLPRLSTLYMGARRLRMVRKIESPSLTRTIIMVTPRGFEKNRIIKAVKQEILNGLPKSNPS